MDHLELAKKKSATSAQLLKKNSKMQKTKARLSIFSKAEKAEKLRIFFSRSATRKKKLYGWSSSQH